MIGVRGEGGAVLGISVNLSVDDLELVLGIEGDFF